MSYLGFHHVAIIVSNYELSKSFYTEILGFEVVAENLRKERGSYKLDLKGPAGMQIELFSFPSTPVRVSNPEACGLRHLAFAVSNLEDEVERLRELGVECEELRVDEYTGKRFTFFKDPDGLPLELYEV